MSCGIVSSMLRDSDRTLATVCSMARSRSMRRRSVMSRLNPTTPTIFPSSSRIGTLVVADQRCRSLPRASSTKIGCSRSRIGSPVATM
jgi:hypothetical protein